MFIVSWIKRDIRWIQMEERVGALLSRLLVTDDLNLAEVHCLFIQEFKWCHCAASENPPDQ